MSVKLEEIKIRTTLQAGDIGYITYLHGIFHFNECGYGLEFEGYVAQGLNEFLQKFNPAKERVWICEYNGKIVGSLLLMDRGSDTAQLRYFILEPEYRGLGLGKKLMELFVAFLREKNYRQCYLWTTGELKAAAGLYEKFGFELSEEKETVDFGIQVTEQRYDFFM